MAQCARGRLDLAERSLLRALELVADLDPDLEPAAVATRVRSLVTLSTVEQELRGHDAGLARLHEAEGLAERSGDPGLGFAVDSALALQHLRRGDHDAALAHFARAEASVAHASVSDACILHLNRGNLMLQRLQLTPARRDLRRCLTLAGEQPDDSRLLGWSYMARHNLGYLEFLAGNLPQALQIMDGAVAPDGVSPAIAAMDRARVLLEAGLSDAADRVLQEAEESFRHGRLHHERAEAELARAECAMLAGDLRTARTLAAAARTRFKRRGDDRWRRVAELTLVSADLADQRPPTRLLAPATRLAAEFDAEGLAVQARTAELIACAALTRAGRIGEARDRVDRLPGLHRTDPITLRLQQRAVTASLLRAAGDTSRARRHVRSGLSELSRHQAQFGSIDLQTASAVHGRALVQLDLELAVADRSAAAVFDAIERGRAVSRRLTPVTPPADESAELLTELRQLTEIIKAIGDDPAARSHVAGLRTRTGRLYEQLSSLSWRAVGAGDVENPAALADVAALAAAHGTTLVSFCNVDGGWSAVVLAADRIEWLPLSAGAEVLELARRAQVDLGVLAFRSLPDALRTAVQASLRHTLRRLDDALIAPLRLGDEPLAVIPTGPTATLPWNCLPSLRGRAVEVAPTATSWLAGAAAADLAGPVVVEAFSGPGLATAGREAAEVAEVWGARARPVISGTDATRDRLAAALADATVVHVAAHGAHMRQNPMFSSLELADGPLFAYEIADRTVAPHVVLSACELGQATTRVGDEALGLARVLLQLGSQCVVAGVSQVADDVAAEVMADYHRRLAAGDDSATALAGATATGPYVPFICFGSSWRALDPAVPVGPAAGSAH